MAYLSVDNINNWLATSKYSVSAVNADMENNAAALVLGKLDGRYAIEDWVDQVSTPDMIVSILAMLVAAWEYDRAVSEDGEGDSYAARLERRAMELLMGLSDGTITIPDVPQDPSADSGYGPAFFPTDDSTELFAEDPYDPEGSPRAFTMGMKF